MNLKKMPKEELELLSYTQIAKMYLEETKKTMTTANLFKEVCKLLELDESSYESLIADFFQSLATSKEFILLDNGKWDLKAKHPVKIEVEEDEEIIPEEEDDEELVKEDDDEEDLDDYDATDDDFEDDEFEELSVVDEEELE